MAPSLLYPGDSTRSPEPLVERRFAVDLNLDQVFAPITGGREQLDLASVLYAPLEDLDQVAYRHEVLADLERPEVLSVVKAFGQAMRQSRDTLTTARSLHSALQQRRHFVDAVLAYTGAVSSLSNALSGLQLCSRAMNAFNDYLHAYTASTGFTALVDEAGNIVRALDAIRYKVQIRGTRVTVSAYQGEPDYADQVEESFARFREHPTSDYSAKLASPLDMDHVEAQVLECVARLFPRPFASMEQYSRSHQDFLDPGVAAFDRGSQFYLAYLGYIEPMRAAGLELCYPQLSTSPGQVFARGLFDLALAAQVTSSGSGAVGRPGVVTNDFEMAPHERILVVTGPNNGGKTTFARAFGQLHYLASLGLLVPAREATIILADTVHTSFEQAEQLGARVSHLEDELAHLHEVIERASPRSVVVMNESFSSTTLRDAAVLGGAVLGKLAARNALCLYVTFIDELATAGASTVSMVVSVDPDDPVRRTYKLVRKAPEGQAYAAALAERYGLSYRAVEQQVSR